MTAYAAQFAKHQTLVASTVDSVALSWTGKRVRIVNRDAALLIYATIGGPTVAGVTSPTVAGDDTFVVMPATSVDLPWPSQTLTPVVVKLISSGTAAYSVEVLTDLARG